MYKLNVLPYLYQDLEPFIDTHTIGLHYQKHAKNYLDKLNELLKKYHYGYSYQIEELPKYLNQFPPEDRENISFNLGGVLNHEVYFKSMSPKPNKPKGVFLSHLEREFGGYHHFLEEIRIQALNLKGSGYIFLVVDKNNKLALISMKNQETPYIYDLIPIFCIDMWEHAYYLNVQNNKNLYIDNFFKVADFSMANNYFEEEKREN